jgi:phosphoribosyl 1,2-cyclic phosphodiesterase
MRFASLGSGSMGNSLLVEVGQTRILLDCGFGLRDTETRLARLNISPEQITGIVVTHEHDDHAGGVFKLANKYRTPVYLSHGTLAMTQRFLPKTQLFKTHIIDSHHLFEINEIEVTPFPVPHDAREPLQFVFSDGNSRLGVLTDTGCSTPHIEATLSACDALILECNHDINLLMNGAYSRALKNRIAGRLGHLDNKIAANILANLDNRKLKHILAAHLSEQNNHPDLAREALAQSLHCEKSWIGIADQNIGFDWRSL